MTSPAKYAQTVYSLPPSAFDTPALKNPGQEPGQLDAEDLGLGGDLPTKGTRELMQALEELDQARQDYALADQMYDGELGDLPVSEIVARLLRKANVNDIEDLCYARVVVDTIASKLGIRAVMVAPVLDEQTQQAPDDGSDALVKAAQDELDRIRRLSQMDVEEIELLLRASRYGEAYLEVWPVAAEVDPGVVLAPEDVGVPDEDATLSATGQPEAVAIYVDSPWNVRAFYDPEQPLRMTHVIKAWEWIHPDDEQDAERDGDPPTPRQRATLFYPDRIERWITKKDGDPRNREDWIPYIEDGEEWPAQYPPGVDRPPFFHHRNSRPYGCPEHKPAYGPQRLINKLVAAQGVVVDFQIFPQRYMLLDPKGDHGLMNLIDPDSPEDMDDDPEGDGHSQLRSDPSAVWRITASSVGQFQPADPAVFLQPLERWIKSISELCGIPLDRFTGYTTPPSGESRRVGNEVLYEKVADRRRRYGGTLSDAYEYALRLMGYDVQVDVKWDPLGAAVGREDWDIVSQKVANGVPVKIALVEAGYPEDEVEQWLNDQAGMDLNRKVALLGQVGTAVQALAAGVGAGVVSRDQAAQIIARLLQQIGEELPELEQPVLVQPPPTPPTPVPTTQPPPPLPGAGGGEDEGGGPAGPPPGPVPAPLMPPPDPIEIA